MATTKNATRKQTSKVDRPPGSVDEDPQVVAARERLDDARGERSQARQDHNWERRAGVPKGGDRDRHRARVAGLAERLREAEETVGVAESEWREAVEDAEGRIAVQRAAWVRQHVSAFADDSTLRKADGRLADARKALGEREDQRATAQAHLERLRTSRDPDDVDRIADAEREVERARRHVELVAETVAELEDERAEAADVAADKVEGQVADRQEVLAGRLRAALEEVVEVLDEEDELRTAVAGELSDGLGRRVTVARRVLPDSIHARPYEHLRERVVQALGLLGSR